MRTLDNVFALKLKCGWTLRNGLSTIGKTSMIKGCSTRGGPHRFQDCMFHNMEPGTKNGQLKGLGAKVASQTLNMMISHVTTHPSHSLPSTLVYGGGMELETMLSIPWPLSLTSRLHSWDLQPSTIANLAKSPKWGALKLEQNSRICYQKWQTPPLNNIDKYTWIELQTSQTCSQYHSPLGKLGGHGIQYPPLRAWQNWGTLKL